MASIRVLVVDDSFMMRTLVSSALERIPNVEIVGEAASAAEARELVPQLHPDVMTLDVEMPGMSGIEYLAEIMSTRPMPVIIFSARATEGAAESIEALRLGAIDCFPKPRAAQSEMDAMIAKLGKSVKAAKDAKLRLLKPEGAQSTIPPIDWNGRLLVVGGDTLSTAELFEIFSAFPDNCPPTLVVQHLGPGLLEGLVSKLDEQIAPQVVVAADGMTPEQGTIYFAPTGEHHLVIDAWPTGTLRLLARDPVKGERPSISLLFAAAAKAAGTEVVGIMLARDSEDGAGGLKVLRDAGAHAFSVGDEGEYLLQRRLSSQPVAHDALAAGILKVCAK